MSLFTEVSVKLLVTGGCGFIGSNFIRYVISKHPDWCIVNLDKLTYAGNLENLKDIEEGENYRFIRGDIADRELIDDLFGAERFDAVLNFAAESHVDRSILDPSPFVDTNVKGVQVLLEASRKYGVKRFIQISTDEVYGSLGEDGFFTESSPLMPNSPYAASKASGDLLCRAYYVTYGVPVIVTRSSNNYGPYQFPEKLIPFMIRNAIKGKPLPVYGKGDNVRDWLYVEDNCEAICMVLEKGRAGEVYNIGGGCEKRNIEVVELVCRILREEVGDANFNPRIEFIEDPRGAAHDFRYALDCTKIENEVGWRPRTDFEEGLRRTVRWYLENQEWMERVITGEYMDFYRKVYGNRVSGGRV